MLMEYWKEQIARVVNLSSDGHEVLSVVFEDVNLEQTVRNAKVALTQVNMRIWFTCKLNNNRPFI